MGVKLEKNDLTKSWLIWVTFGQQCYNFEIMQGLGFAHAMCPVIRRLYPDDQEKRREALERHLTYYNTENNCELLLQAWLQVWKRKKRMERKSATAVSTVLKLR